MTPDASNFYISGGTLRADAPSYVERKADRDLLEGLRRGEFCYVLTSRQMGKSSLMVRNAHVLRTQGTGTVILDLTALGQNVTPEQWYDGLGLRLGQQLQLEDEIEEFWQSHLRLGPCQRWFTALREVVLPRLVLAKSSSTPFESPPRSLVIFIDELDVVRSLPFSTDEFFAAIRECYNRRIEDPAFSRMAFCLLGVAAPSELMQNPRTTPFNVGQRIELTDFTPDEAEPLARRLNELTPRCASLNTSTILQRVLHWTHGHPYLTQRTLGTIAAQAETTDAGREEHMVDRICDDLFLSARARESDDNLLFVRERLLRSEVDLNSLLDLYERILRNETIEDNELNPLITQLRLAGLVRSIDDRLVVRNRIYQHVFDQTWIAANRLIAELEMPDGKRTRLRGSCTLGRTDANDIVLSDIKVSRRHALIQLQGKDELWLVDLGSRNGTSLNGHRLTSATLLRDKDRIEIGPFALTLRQPNAPRLIPSNPSTIAHLDKTLGG